MSFMLYMRLHVREFTHLRLRMCLLIASDRDGWPAGVQTMHGHTYAHFVAFAKLILSIILPVIAPVIYLFNLTTTWREKVTKRMKYEYQKNLIKIRFAFVLMSLLCVRFLFLFFPLLFFSFHLLENKLFNKLINDCITPKIIDSLSRLPQPQRTNYLPMTRPAHAFRLWED